MKMGQNMKANFGRAVKTGILGAVGALTVGLGLTIREFVQYDQAITAASAKFKGLNLATDEGQKTLLSLKKVARVLELQLNFQQLKQLKD